MRLLIDTHILLWFLFRDPQLTSKALQILRDPQNQVLVSHVSLWEIGIKVNTGRLQLNIVSGVGAVPFLVQEVQANGFTLLPITVPHLEPVASLPLHHRDPFDRLLIAQAMTENVPVLSADGAFDACPVTRLW